MERHFFNLTFHYVQYSIFYGTLEIFKAINTGSGSDYDTKITLRLRSAFIQSV
jgi:hypothetical protein